MDVDRFETSAAQSTSKEIISTQVLPAARSRAESEDHQVEAFLQVRPLYQHNETLAQLARDRPKSVSSVDSGYDTSSIAMGMEPIKLKRKSLSPPLESSSKQARRWSPLRQSWSLPGPQASMQFKEAISQNGEITSAPEQLPRQAYTLLHATDPLRTADPTSEAHPLHVVDMERQTHSDILPRWSLPPEAGSFQRQFSRTSSVSPAAAVASNTRVQGPMPLPAPPIHITESSLSKASRTNGTAKDIGEVYKPARNPSPSHQTNPLAYNHTRQGIHVPIFSVIACINIVPACVPCRKKKTGCDLRAIGNNYEPPCQRCRVEEIRCFFAGSGNVPDNPNPQELPSIRDLACTHCSAVFLRNVDLRAHTKTECSEKHYICQHCDARFRRLNDLDRHSRIHSGEKPHQCNICARRFSRATTLTRHRKGPEGCAGRRADLGKRSLKMTASVHHGPVLIASAPPARLEPRPSQGVSE